ncbi:MAG: D-2-hydroxyacid dehydrogenase [Lachnospiraceae bacterium]|nr:D-2-hydroxyacid dehydrogenase [Lachnospiraceae bacterium]
MKIVVLDGQVENPGDLSWEGFEQQGELTIYSLAPSADKEEVIHHIGGSPIVITNKVPITEEILAACPGIRYIGLLSTGYNIIDLEATAKRGIPVTNIPNYSTQTVAQHTFALLLELCARTGDHARAVKEGRWCTCPDFCFWDYPIVELHGKTMGLIGFGNIGQAVARIAQAFGMEVLLYSRTRRPELETDHCKYTDLDSLLAKSDIISLHCPLFPETTGMINKENIAKMKDGVFLINTARGPLVEEQDLADALRTGKIGAAALDVLSREPALPDNPLLEAPNCLITPHIAWAAREARQRLMDVAVGNLEAFLAGEKRNVVNLCWNS